MALMVCLVFLKDVTWNHAFKQHSFSALTTRHVSMLVISDLKSSQNQGERSFIAWEKDIRTRMKRMREKPMWKEDFRRVVPSNFNLACYFYFKAIFPESMIFQLLSRISQKVLMLLTSNFQEKLFFISFVCAEPIK